MNPDNTNLQIRWDQKQGFFVEGLLVIECKKPEDIVEVILQGTKNRKISKKELLAYYNLEITTNIGGNIPFEIYTTDKSVEDKYFEKQKYQ